MPDSARKAQSRELSSELDSSAHALANQQKFVLFLANFFAPGPLPRLAALANSVVKASSKRILQQAGLFLKELDLLFKLSLSKHLILSPLIADLRITATESFTADFLIKTFEDLITAANPNQHGVFYTPPVIVDFITAQTITVPPLKILDPSCSAGGFLISAFRRLLQNETKIDPKKLLPNSIYGVDIDALACEVCKLALQVELINSSTKPPAKYPDLSNNIISGHALLSSNYAQQDLFKPSKKALTAFNWQQNFSAVFSGNNPGFDIVIGNPPYGLSRDEQLTKEENEQLKENFSSSRVGKVNKYLLFMAKGYELLAKGGVLSYIVPNAWLGIDAGRNIRKQWLADEALESLCVFHYPVFKDVGVETVIFKAHKDKKFGQIKINHIYRGDSLSSAKNHAISAKFCLESNDTQIPLFWREECDEIFKQIDAISSPLSAICQPLIAMQAYLAGRGKPAQTKAAVKNHIFHFAEKIDADTYPYLEGSDVQRYKQNWSGRYLRYGPWVAEYQPLERYQGPRILLREIINKPPYLLIAAYTAETVLYNKSVLHILPRPGTSIAVLEAMVAVLNSVLGSFVIKFRGRKSQRSLFPKIVKADLDDFPIPKNFRAYTKELAMLSRKAAKESAVSATLQHEIDNLVCKAYGLSPATTEKLYNLLIDNRD